MLASLCAISHSYGTDVILSNINQNIDASDKIGLIGPNGGGKSTLMKIMAGVLRPEAGSFSLSSGAKVGYLTQDMGLEENLTIYEETLKAFSEVIALEGQIGEIEARLSQEHDEEKLIALSETLLSKNEQFEKKRGYYYKSVVSATLKGIGFSDEMQERKIASLSGGQKMRVALAKLLIAEPELLLLDEPTNYLDMMAMQWLENYLSQYKKAYIVVSHDRYFLERAVSKIWELDEHDINMYRGNYTAYLNTKEQERYSAQKAFKQQSDYIKRQQQIIDRLMSYNRVKSIKRAQSREKLLTHIDRLEEPKEEKTARISFRNKDVISSYALRCAGLCIGYDGSKLVGPLDILVKTGEKIGVCGDNATGKTTLIKTINSEIPKISGEIIYGAGAVITHFRQQHEDLNKNNSLLAELVAYSGCDNTKVRNVLGSLLFTGDDVFKPIGVLSGGELARVAVAKLMLTGANILLLDEPTNHLDIASKEVFEQALSDYSGTVIVISHDRYLLNRLCDRIVYIEKGCATVYEGNYDSLPIAKDVSPVFKYSAEKKKEEEKASEDLGKSDSSEEKKKAPLSKNERMRLDKRLSEVELKLPILEERIARLEKLMTEADFGRDAEYAAEKVEEYEQTKAERESYEQIWLETTLALEEG